MGQLCHIAVTKAGVCAEAEHVSGAVEAGGEGDFLFVFLSLDIGEFDLCPLFRYNIVVEGLEFVLGEKDDGLVDDLELWHIVLEVIGNWIVFLLCPAEEPFEEFDVFLDGDIAHLKDICFKLYKSGEEGFGHVGELEVLAVFGQMGFEGDPFSFCIFGPLFFCALLSDELVKDEIRVDGLAFFCNYNLPLEGGVDSGFQQVLGKFFV